MSFGVSITASRRMLPKKSKKGFWVLAMSGFGLLLMRTQNSQRRGGLVTEILELQFRLSVT